MALKALLLNQQRRRVQTDLDALRAKTPDFDRRCAELETAIGEANTEEDQTAVAALVATYDTERAAHDAEIQRMETEIADLTRQIQEEEAKAPAPPPATPATDPNHPTTAPPVERKDDNTMPNSTTRGRFFGMTRAAFGEFVKSESQAQWLQRVRDLGLQGRAVSNVEVTIPTDVLGLMRDNLPLYSKLLKHVNARFLKGKARTNVLGVVPEGIWTEMIGTLNELSLAFADVETDGYMVGGFIPINNAYLEDSDENLALELITALTKAIAIGIDKAIAYGKGTKMPMGIVTRLVMTEAPENYKNSLPFKDLSGTNVIALGNKTGTALFKALLEASGNISTQYGSGEIFWAMNRRTYTKLLAESLGVNANGSIVAGMNKTMPIVGGAIETCDWMPDDVIIGGADDLYLLVERSGAVISRSEHAQFIQNNTLFKGLARYDGIPVIAEGFVVISLGADKPTATAVTFAADKANSGT
jgi:HK97 family phage major capsid protein